MYLIRKEFLEIFFFFWKMARLLLDRSRDLVDYPDATSNKTRKNNRDPDEDDAHDFDLYHNPDPGHFANSDHADASA